MSVTLADDLVNITGRSTDCTIVFTPVALFPHAVAVGTPATVTTSSHAFSVTLDAGVYLMEVSPYVKIIQVPASGGPYTFKDLDITEPLSTTVWSRNLLRSSGIVSATNIITSIQASTPSGSYAVNYDGAAWQEVSVSADLSISTTNGAAGKSVTLKIKNTGSSAINLTFIGLTFVCTAPTTLAAGKVAVLTCNYCSDGTQVAAYSAQP